MRKCQQAEKLGTGSFSTVYRYEEIATGKSVAIKVLSDAVSRKSEKISLEQVLCELTTLGKVSHPNVLSFLSALVDKKLFIITELIDGHDLLDIAVLSREVTGNSTFPVLYKRSPQGFKIPC